MPVADRVREFETLLNRYNGKVIGIDYEFDKINVVSGERDPDAEVQHMSLSKMRDAAKDDFKSFSKILPTSFRDKQKLFALVRKGT